MQENGHVMTITLMMIVMVFMPSVPEEESPMMGLAVVESSTERVLVEVVRVEVENVVGWLEMLDVMEDKGREDRFGDEGESDAEGSKGIRVRVVPGKTRSPRIVVEMGMAMGILDGWVTRLLDEIEGAGC